MKVTEQYTSPHSTHVVSGGRPHTTHLVGLSGSPTRAFLGHSTWRNSRQLSQCGLSQSGQSMSPVRMSHTSQCLWLFPSTSRKGRMRWRCFFPRRCVATAHDVQRSSSQSSQCLSATFFSHMTHTAAASANPAHSCFPRRPFRCVSFQHLAQYVSLHSSRVPSSTFRNARQNSALALSPLPLLSNCSLLPWHSRCSTAHRSELKGRLCPRTNSRKAFTVGTARGPPSEGSPSSRLSARAARWAANDVKPADALAVARED
mmetsp:Transcript_24740/g.50780  ORF Transcript_24740/g.50780 Transcript_24740/m.50780 type:complete len:259 (+) Transcript_24740:592-1368(+)